MMRTRGVGAGLSEAFKALREGKGEFVDVESDAVSPLSRPKRDPALALTGRALAAFHPDLKNYVRALAYTDKGEWHVQLAYAIDPVDVARLLKRDVPSRVRLVTAPELKREVTTHSIVRPATARELRDRALERRVVSLASGGKKKHYLVVGRVHSGGFIVNDEALSLVSELVQRLPQRVETRH